MTKRLRDVDAMVVSLKFEAQDALAPEAVFRFETAISEALSNLVLHSKTLLSDASIKIDLALGLDEVIIEIFDPVDAAPFDITSNAQDLSDVDLMAEGGRGLGLIMECADTVTYGPVRDQNRLRLTFTARH